MTKPINYYFFAFITQQVPITQSGVAEGFMLIKIAVFTYILEAPLFH